MDAKNDRSCQVCGRAVEKSAQFDMCPDCLGKLKDRLVRSEPEPEKPSPRRKDWILTAVLAVCAVVIALRIPAFRGAIAILSPPPANAGDATDLCVANLWHASSLIQEGRWTSGGESCPLTKSPFRTTTAGDDLVVSCPNPAAHGLRALWVSRKHPAPEIVP